MFDRNDPAMPTAEIHSSNRTVIPATSGLTKFEQCAMEFAAALFSDPNMKTENAIKNGILAAEGFCKQMEEREK